MNYRFFIAFLIVITTSSLCAMEQKREQLSADIAQGKSKVSSLFTLCVDKLTFEHIVHLMKYKNSFQYDCAMSAVNLKKLLPKSLVLSKVLTQFLSNSGYVALLQITQEIEQKIARILVNNNQLRSTIADCFTVPSYTFEVQNGNDVNLSMDGNYIAIGLVNGSVQVWDTRDKKFVYLLNGHIKTVNAVRWSWDSKYLASASNDNTVRIWQVDTGTCIKTLRHGNKVCAVCWNSDGSFLASGDDSGNVYLWDVSAEKATMLYGHTGSVKAVSWSDDDTYVASGSVDFTVRIWNAKTGEYTLLESMSDLATMSPFAHAACSIAWSHDGSYLITSSDNCKVYVWDIALGRCIHSMYGHVDWVRMACLSLDGHYIVGGSDNGVVRIWDIDTNTHLCTLQASQGWVNMIGWGFHCSYIIAGTSSGVVHVWDIRDIKKLNNLNLEQALLLELLQSKSIETIIPYPHLCTIFRSLPVFVKQLLDSNRVIPAKFLSVLEYGKNRSLGTAVPVLPLPSIQEAPFCDGLPEPDIDEITAQEATTLQRYERKKVPISLFNKVVAVCSCLRFYWPLGSQLWGKMRI